MAKSNEPQNVFPAGGVFSEPQLVVPALFVMAHQKQNVTTTTLIQELTRLLKPTGQDAQILSGRGDTHFSQKVSKNGVNSPLSSVGI